MPNEATSTLTGTSATDEAMIDSLLGGAPETVESDSETEQNTGDHAEEQETETPKESEVAAAETEEATEEEAETEEKAEAETEEESELSIDESDRDYSTAAYEKAAKHYSRTHGVQLNPEDPAHRALLKEVMDRGEALKRQATEREAAKEKPDEGKEKATEEVKAEEPIKFTPEQIQAGIHDIEEVAKARVVPEVAMHVASRFVKALWPGEKIEMTQEQANDFTSALHAFFLMAMNDAAPAVYGMVNKNLSADPVWGPARTEAIEARAFEHLDKTKGADWFASMETLVENGLLKKVIADNPDIFKNIKAGNGRDPVLNRAAQLEAAYKIARGDQTIQQVTKAVETGKKQAADSAKKIAAGRVAAGTSKGGFSKPASEAGKIVSDIVTGGGSKFGAAVKAQLRK